MTVLSSRILKIRLLLFFLLLYFYFHNKENIIKLFYFELNRDFLNSNVFFLVIFNKTHISEFVKKKGKEKKSS